MSTSRLPTVHPVFDSQKPVLDGVLQCDYFRAKAAQGYVQHRSLPFSIYFPFEALSKSPKGRHSSVFELFYQPCQGSGVGSIPIGRSLKSITYRRRHLRGNTKEQLAFLQLALFRTAGYLYSWRLTLKSNRSLPDYRSSPVLASVLLLTVPGK